MPVDNNNDTAKRNIFAIKDIHVQCSAENEESPALDGMVLRIKGMSHHLRLGLGKVSSTMWKVDCDTYIPIMPQSFSVVALSEHSIDLGHGQFDTCDSTLETVSGCVAKVLKQTLEMVGNTPTLAFSCKIYTLSLNDILDGTLEDEVNPLMLLDVVESLLDDVPVKADALHYCGVQFQKTFEISQLEEDMQTAIGAYEAAAELLSLDDIRFASYMNDVGLAYKKSFSVSGRLQDIEAANSKWRRLVAMLPEGHYAVMTVLCNLGRGLLDSFKSTGGTSDISEAIEVLQRAVDSTSSKDSGLPERLTLLGSSYLHRFQRTGQDADNSSSIHYLQRAVQLVSEEHEDLPIMLGNLGNALSTRFERFGELTDLSEAICHRQRALQLAPAGHRYLIGFLSNLGISHSLRFQALGDVMDISESIRLHQRAIQLSSSDEQLYIAALTNLAKSHLLRFEHSGELTDLSEAIQTQQRSLELTPDSDPDLPNQLNNFGSLIMTRFERFGDDVDLSKAIQIQQRAVFLAPDGVPTLAGFVANLGRLLFRRFERDKKLTDISDAIQALQRAVSLTPDQHPNLPELHQQLGIAYLCRFQRAGQPRDISRAVDLMQRAVSSTPDGHPELSIRLNNVSRLYHFCFERSRDSRIFDLAISASRQAAMSSTGPPYVFVIAAKRWAQLSGASLAPPSELLEAHQHIIRLLSFNAGLQNTLKRRHELLLESSQLSTAAAAVALSVNEVGKALEWLEEGRCIVWTQINSLRTPLDDLRDHNADLADRFSTLSKRLENAGSRTDPYAKEMTPSMAAKITFEEDAHDHLKLVKERDDLLTIIRNIDGFDSFLRPKAWTDLMKDLPNEGPIIVINAAEDRCDALALLAGSDEPIHIRLERITYKRANSLAEELRRYLSSYRLRVRISEEIEPRGLKLRHRQNQEKDLSLQRILAILWTDLVEPILQALAVQIPHDGTDLTRIWWCPTGPFMFLPIHAAGVYDYSQTSGRSLTDFAISSYVPSVSILKKTRNHPDPDANKKGVLLISQPDTPGFPKIPCTIKEARNIKELLDKGENRSALYESSEATVDITSESMDSYSCIHLACHASQEITNPLESAIHLYDGPLKLSDLMKKDLPNADIAYLSACQTSTGDEKLPEEAVHLAAGMLAAGYRSVIATMWAISDEHAPEVAETFYQSLLVESQMGARLEGTRAAEALHTATRHLQKKLGSSTRALLAWIPYIHVGV